MLASAIPPESLALSGNGAFTTPIRAAWDIADGDGQHVALVVEYLEVPTTWAAGQVLPVFRGISAGSLNGPAPIPQGFRWVRIRPGSLPSFARSLDEALRLISLDLSRERARSEAR